MYAMGLIEDSKKRLSTLEATKRPKHGPTVPPAPTAEVINKMEESWFGSDPLNLLYPPRKLRWLAGTSRILDIGDTWRYIDL